MDKARSLRWLLEGKNLTAVGGAYDAISAKIAQDFGFPVIYMTGYGVAAAHGYPDFGLLTMTEMLESLRRMRRVLDVPLIADADTGYGNPLNVYRTVQEYEDAGADGIQLEDQVWPKRCGHMKGKMVVDESEMVNKVKAAVDARRNDETIIIARTDAIATDGFEEAIHRGKNYAEAGADVIFIEAPDADQIPKIPSLIPKPCLINLPFPGKDVDLAALQAMGYSLALYPILTLLGAIEGCQRRCKIFMEEGRYVDSEITPFDFEELNQFIGIEKYRKLDRKYVARKEDE